ncbi:MAG TPA: c-type cytochrome domain-containing protein [Bryobacteraceae bacterium]|nr:c-type cytochrome domain-containing protein [Bryobacteraceae bacterium]
MRSGLILCGIGILACAFSRAQDTPSFARDVVPIVAANCAGCHGANVRMGSLNLDTYEGVQKGGNNGKIIEPGKSSESRLYLMITGKLAPAMPLSGKRLAEGDVEIIRKWIDAGANPPTPEEARELAARLARPEIPDVQQKAAVKPQIGALAFSPDGKLLALGTYKEVRLTDPADKHVIAALTGHAEAIRALAFSRDGRLLAAAGGLPARSGELKIWDVEGRKEIRTIQGHSDCIYAVAFSPDGKTVATASYDKLIKLWEVSSGKEIRTFKDHIDAIYAIAFTQDGKRLISGAADRTVKVWDAATGERLYTLSDPQDGLNTLALDPTGKFVAAGGLDKTVRVWSLGPKGGALVNSLIAHEDAILAMAYSPDGKLLASSAADKTIKIFNAGDLTEIKTLDHQPDWVLSLEFSPDGKTFAAGRYDGSLEIYNVGQVLNAPVHQARTLPH